MTPPDVVRVAGHSLNELIHCTQMSHTELLFSKVRHLFLLVNQATGPNVIKVFFGGLGGVMGLDLSAWLGVSKIKTTV